MPWAYDSVHMAHRNRDLMLSVLKDRLMRLALAEDGPCSRRLDAPVCASCK